LQRGPGGNASGQLTFSNEFRRQASSIYAGAMGRSGASWKPEVRWMPRFSLSYRLGEKNVLKAGYGIYYDTLNAADYPRWLAARG
jgi:hypothetical protein